MQKLLNEQQLDLNKRTIGLELDVLFDRKNEEKGQFHGRTPYNQAIHVKTDENIYGNVCKVMVRMAHANSLTGELTSEAAGEDKTIAVN